MGVLVMQPQEDFFKGALERTERKKVTAYIIDQRGQVVYCSNQKIDRLGDFSSHFLVQRLQQGLRGEERTTSLNGREIGIAAYRPVPPLWLGGNCRRTG